MLATSKTLTSYEFTESIVKVGDVFHRNDHVPITFVVASISELSWRVGKKRTKKCEHTFELFTFESGKSITVTSYSFRKYYLINESCKKIWSVNVPNERNDYVS